MPPGSCLTRLRAPLELAGGRARSEARSFGVVVRKPPVGWSLKGRSEASGCCKTPSINTHKPGKNKIVYEFHPWFGRELSVHCVVEKGMGLVRCTRQGDLQPRALEVPLWMFDHLTCVSVRLRKRPQVDLAALDALKGLLDEIPRPEGHALAGSLIAPDSVTDVPSVNQDQGGDHGSISQGTKATGSVRSRKAGRFREHAVMAESSGSDAGEGNQPAGEVVRRTLPAASDGRDCADRRSSSRGGR